jgi:hypothetical protein
MRPWWATLVAVAKLVLCPLALLAQTVENVDPTRSLDADKAYCSDYADRMTRQAYYEAARLRATTGLAGGLVAGLSEIGLDEAAKSHFWQCLESLGWSRSSQVIEGSNGTAIVTEDADCARTMEATEKQFGPPFRRDLRKRMAQFEYHPTDRPPAYVIFTRQSGGRCSLELRPSPLLDDTTPEPEVTTPSPASSAPSFLTH